MLELAPLQKLGRIVFLGSPLRGNVIARSLSCRRLGRFILGPVACEGIVEKRPPLPTGRELLVVAGTFPLGFGFLFGLPSPHDGTVAVVETKVPGANVLPVRASHMGMVFSPGVAGALGTFFRTGVL
jgi:hypothetical protein